MAIEDRGEVKASGTLHCWRCEECSRDFLAALYEEDELEEVPSFCPWCGEAST
jgi:uncharacterized protein CbrC (UPF0167 family)